MKYFLFSFTKSLTIFPRRMSSTLISNSKYSFLKELELVEENQGVFDGEWKASGNVVESTNPVK